MGQTFIGRIKQFCNVHGITVEEYCNNIFLGFKWCHKCGSWVKVEHFNKDSYRYDGLCAKCIDCSRVKVKKIRKGVPNGRKGIKITGIGLENIRTAAKKTAKKRIGKKKKYTVDGYKRLLIAVRKPRPEQRGKNNPRWKGGSEHDIQKLRNLSQYIEWRKAVYERDRFTCQDCGDNKGGNLQAHHKKPFATFPQLRFDVDNGVTLCEPCHKKYHSKAA